MSGITSAHQKNLIALIEGDSEAKAKRRLFNRFVAAVLGKVPQTIRDGESLIFALGDGTERSNEGAIRSWLERNYWDEFENVRHDHTDIIKKASMRLKDVIEEQSFL